LFCIAGKHNLQKEAQFHLVVIADRKPSASSRLWRKM